MKAELNIDTAELEENVVQKVVTALKPLLREKAGEDALAALLSVKGLAGHLSVSEKWIYERVQFKEIPHYKVGGNLRFKRSEIDRWLDEKCKTPAVNPLSGALKIIK